MLKCITWKSIWERILFRKGNFSFGKRDKRRKGSLLKSSCFHNLFLCPVTHLFTISAFKTPRSIYNPYIFHSSPHSPEPNLPSFSDHPLIVVGKKGGVHGCQTVLKTPWTIDLQHFSAPWHYLERNWIGNPRAGDGIKMFSLLEEKENWSFTPSPSSPKNREEKTERTVAIEKKGAVYTHLNAVTIYWRAMNNHEY